MPRSRCHTRSSGRLPVTRSAIGSARKIVAVGAVFLLIALFKLLNQFESARKGSGPKPDDRS